MYRCIIYQHRSVPTLHSHQYPKSRLKSKNAFHSPIFDLSIGLPTEIQKRLNPLNGRIYLFHLCSIVVHDEGSRRIKLSDTIQNTYTETLIFRRITHFNHFLVIVLFVIVQATNNKINRNTNRSSLLKMDAGRV